MPRSTPTAAVRRRRAVLLGCLTAAVVAFVVGASAGASSGSGGGASVGYVKALPVLGPSASAVEQRAFDKVRGYADFLDKGAPNKKEVALTFDDGPGANTPQVLAILNKTKTPAAFFTIGQQYPDLSANVQAEALGGFTVGDHTENHPVSLNGMSASEVAAQIDGVTQQAAKVGVPAPKFFRPPGGFYNATVLDALKQRKMLMVLWAVDSEDWRLPGTDAIVQNVLGAATAGDVILMHDGGGDRSQTVAALPKIISGLRKRGLEPVSLGRLLADDPPPQDQMSALTRAGE